eukprot:1159613-Pelagomonas_calceolata.AAC.9
MSQRHQRSDRACEGQLWLRDHSIFFSSTAKASFVPGVVLISFQARKCQLWPTGLMFPFLLEGNSAPVWPANVKAC